MREFKVVRLILLVSLFLFIGGIGITGNIYNENASNIFNVKLKYDLGNNRKIKGVFNNVYNEFKAGYSNDENTKAARIAVPESLKIGADSKVIGILEYEDFCLKIRKITARVGVAYCLEDDKDYPMGETFDVEGKVSEAVAKVLVAGYPCKTAKELGIENDDDAYIATQIALWSIYEGYNPNSFKGGNSEILKAINNICENANKVNLNEIDDLFIEYYSNDLIQRIVIKI